MNTIATIRPRVPLEAQALIRVRTRLRDERRRLESLEQKQQLPGNHVITDEASLRLMATLLKGTQAQLSGIRYAEAVVRGELRAILGKEVV